MTVKLANVLGAALLSVAVAGCAGGSRVAPNTAANSPDPVTLGGDARATPTAANRPLVPAVEGLPPAMDAMAVYVIGPRDLLSVKVFKVEELSAVERVSEAGTIVLPLVGPVEVAGLTPDQAEARIAEALVKDFMYDPQVDVFVKEYANMTITVSGSVKKPGVFPISGKTTLVQAVAQAEGPTEVASVSNVIIFRGLPGQSVTAYVVDYRKIQRGELPDPVLVSNDKVVVPESGAAVMLKNVTGALRGFVYAPLL